MIEYGLLASKSSEIFSGFWWQLKSLWDSTLFFPALIVIGILVIVAYFLIRIW
jgi:hypothetical protein